MNLLRPTHVLIYACLFASSVTFAQIADGGYLSNGLSTVLSALSQNGSSLTLDNELDFLKLLRTLDVSRVLESVGDQTSLLENLGSVVVTSYLRSVGVSEKCSKDFDIILQGLMDRQMWAIQMLDAIGKPPSEILSFTLIWPGSYSECLGVKAITYTNDTIQSDPTVQFTGRYCLTDVTIPKNLTANIPQLSLIPGPIELSIGTCAPDSCNSADVDILLKAVLSAVSNGSIALDTSVRCHHDREIGADVIVVTCILAFLGLMMVLGTLYDVIIVQREGKISKPVKVQANGNGVFNGHLNNAYAEDPIKSTEMNGGMKSDVVENGTVSNDVNLPIKPKQRGIPERILLAFSVYTNGVKLLGTSQASGSLGAVNGTRFLSMCWVILGHTSYIFTQKSDDNLMPYFYFKKIYQWTFYGIYSTVSVDTFFTLSGLLVAYLTLREMKKLGGAKKMNWFMYYFHRFWRLTPAYMLVLMVLTVLMVRFSNGPFWPQDEPQVVATCRKNWWTNLLYINNFYSGKQGEDMCMAWSWYLADDMQFYILSPLIIVPFFFSPIAGGIIAFLFLVATSFAAGFISKQHEYAALLSAPIGPQPKDDEYANLLYFPCHTRMGPYIVGLVTGYVLYRCKCKCKIPKVVNLACWLICIALVVVIPYGLYPGDDANHFLTVNQAAVYNALHRTGWGIAVAWIIFACATGNGGWINTLLSWSPFVPLGRLTYCAYLIHPIVHNVYTMSRERLLHFSDYEMAYMFLGTITLTYGAAFLVSLAFESPMMGLEKVLFKRDKRS